MYVTIFIFALELEYMSTFGILFLWTFDQRFHNGILQYSKVVKVTTLVTSDLAAFPVTSFEGRGKEALQKRVPRVSWSILVHLSNVFSSIYNYIRFSIYSVPN